jgi:hypothetical protein
MLFSHDNSCDRSLFELANEIRARPVPPIIPLPCDRWVARSTLQKTIRRGEPALAQRALANLFNYDRRATWRHLAIIALEDVGVANIDLLAQLVAAQQNPKWRQAMGGDWPVMAELTRQMAISGHCQAACDLLLKALNDPQLSFGRAAALDAELDVLALSIENSEAPLADRALAALAMSGGLAEGQTDNDPCGVFDLFEEAGRSSQVVPTCRASWKLTRNPMALLLPLIWEQWSLLDRYEETDDVLPSVQMIGGVPGYSLDQFTRTGNSISRAFLRENSELSKHLEAAGITPAARPRALGDILFLIEGGLLKRRVVWPLADKLRLPHRQLPAVTTMEPSSLDETIVQVRSKASQIAQLRRLYFHPQET